jgi:DNA-binding transcriptional LysR family regulator
MDLNALGAFVTFSEDLNFTHAAERLHISQPALHVKIQKLSKQLGVPLYAKHGRVLTLTQHGQELARFGRETQVQVSSFLQTLGLSGQTQKVVLAAGSGCYRYLLAGPLRTFQLQKSSHQSDLQLITSNSLRTQELIREGQAHFGVTVLESLPPDILTHRIHTADGVLVMKRCHPLARRKTLSVKDLAHQDLIVPALGQPLRNSIARLLEAYQVPWTPTVEAGTWELMIHFVEIGLGSAIINGCCHVPRDLVAIPIREFPKVQYYLLSKRTLAFQPPQQLLYDLIKSLGS